MAASASIEGPTARGLERGQIGLAGVLMPGLAQVAPAFNLFFTTGVMAGLAGASVPLVFLISMVGVVATGSTLAQFSSIYPSSGSFLTYIARSIGPRTSAAIGVITIVGYIIAFGGIYIFVGQYIVENVFGDPQFPGATQLVTVGYGILVAAPVVLGLRFGIRVTIALYVFEVALLLAISSAILVHGGAHGLSGTPFSFPHGDTKSVFTAFSLAILAFGGFEASAPLAEETRNPRRNVPIAVLATVVVSGLLYVFGSYALVSAFGANRVSALAADPNPFHTAATRFIPALAPLVTWVFLTSVTSSYIAANTQTSRVIFGGGRAGLWYTRLATVGSRLRTPWVAVIAFVAPSVLIGLVSTAFTDPATASGLLGTWGILGLILMYVLANIALIVHWARERSAGHHGNAVTRVMIPIVGIGVLAIPIWGDLQPGQAAPFNYLPWLTLGLVAAGVLYTGFLQLRRPDMLHRAPALLEGADDANTDERPVSDHPQVVTPTLDS